MATSGIEARLATAESAECSQTTTKYPHLVTYITPTGTFRYTRAPKPDPSVAKRRNTSTPQYTKTSGHRVNDVPRLRVSPQWDSNPHWIDFKSTVSADWTMGGRILPYNSLRGDHTCGRLSHV